jgi:hypothetical protein
MEEDHVRKGGAAMTEAVESPLVPIADAAKFLHCHPDTIYNMEKRGQLHIVRVFRRVFVPKSELARLTEVAPPRAQQRPLVYFIDCGEFTKIGHTKCGAQKRLKGIETNNPHELKLWASVKGDAAAERSWHASLAAYRYRNEWFRLPSDVRQQVRQSIVQQGGQLHD